jgi:hypothetical protein
VTITLGVLGAAILTVALFLLPRRLIRAGQDKLAAEILARDAARADYLLLTPAARLTGRFRRLPGTLGLTRRSLTFESRYSSPFALDLAEIRKIVTGKTLSNGRRLWRDEVVQLTDSSGAVSEFQMSHESAWQWRQHLGVWAARQNAAGAADRPTR